MLAVVALVLGGAFAIARGPSSPTPTPAPIPYAIDTSRTHISNYRFLGSGGASNAVGYFVNSGGTRISDPASKSINQANGTNLPKSFEDLWTSLPTGAEGWIGTFSVAVYVDLEPAPSGTDNFKTGYATGYTTIPANTLVCLGRTPWPTQTAPITVPAALDSSGYFKVHEQGTASIVATAGEAHIGEVGRNVVTVSTTVTLPSDASGTAYAAKDVLADSDSAPTLPTLASIGRVNAGTGKIVKVRMMTDQKTFTGRVRLHFFHTAPTAINNNSPYLMLWSNRANRIGQIDLPAAATEDATNSTAAAAVNIIDQLPFTLAGGSKTIYFIPEVLDAFTAANSQNFYFEVTVENN